MSLVFLDPLQNFDLESFDEIFPEIMDDVTRKGDNQAVEYKTKSEKKSIPVDRVEFTEQDLLQLPELRPPEMMPQGNIGTPTKTFLQYIQDCRLPPQIIKKLGLKFPRTKPKKLFGSVPFDYDGDSSQNLADFEDKEFEENSEKLDRGDNLDFDNIVEESFCDLCNPPLEKMRLTSKNQKSFNQKLHSQSSVIQKQMSDESEDASVKDTRVMSIVQDQPYSVLKSPASAQNSSVVDHKVKRAAKKAEKRRIKELKSERIEEKLINNKSESEEDDDGCEEWERHEANYDDPSNQARNNERLFEEKIELKWEKGGSGLVFYTDAQYWKKFEGDFDEQCADDWDVDMSCYYEENGGDKDSKDLVDMRQENRRRQGEEATDRYTVGKFQNKTVPGPKLNRWRKSMEGKIGQFEKHTKGVGRKIMEQQGWCDGSQLGTSSTNGLVEALENDGKHPYDKKGLGYYGEKLQRFQPSFKKIPRIEKNEHLITTVYDNPLVTDPVEPLLRRNEPYIIKHRPGVSHIEFQKASHS